MRWSAREIGFALISVILIAQAGGCTKIQVWKVRPQPAAQALRSLLHEQPFGQANAHRLTPSLPGSNLIHAEELLKDAKRAEIVSRTDALRLYCECMAIALQATSETPDDRPETLEARAVYNRALGRFLRMTGRHKIRPDESWSALLAQSGVRLGSGDGLWPAKRFDEIQFADDYVTRGLDHFYGADGIGVPLIAIRQPSQEELDNRQGAERFFPYWEVYAVTAVIRFDQSHDGTLAPVLELHDTLKNTQVNITGKSTPLATDLTTPTAYHFARGKLGIFEKISFFNPQKLTREAGLHMLHPYERGKIPVVMVHGLGSSPKAWGKVVNELRGDPQLREKYQFWMYMYPTGNPFVLSAADFRRSLREARQAVDPDETDPAFDQMVLIGHSMGGLITRLAITDSSHALWQLNSPRPIENLVGSPEDRELIERIFYFKALPFVKRAIFIATPHRGSVLGSNFVGRFFDSLIRLPGPLARSHDALIAQNGPEFFTEEFRGGVPSSIDELKENNPYLTTIDKLPAAPWVKAHSIVGKVGQGPLETSSDQVVTYKSTHIPWAISERVVPQNHFCQDHPETVNELKRILRLHLEETGQRR